MKKIFYMLGVVGSIVICICAFVIPSNPHEIIPAISVMGFDKPLWLAIIIVGLFLYNAILCEIYDILQNKTRSW